MAGASAPKPDARKQRHAVAQAQSANRVPVTGRVGRPPKCPVDLGDAGRRWWSWAWTTPQATKWHKGFTEPLARRAALEDDYVRARMSLDTTEAPRLLALMMRLDDNFGLTPLAAAKQHIVFVDEPEPPKAVAGKDATVTPMRSRLKGMRD